MLAAAGDSANVAAHLGGAGKGNEGRYRVLYKGITDVGTSAHHHTQRPGW